MSLAIPRRRTRSRENWDLSGVLKAQDAELHWADCGPHAAYLPTPARQAVKHRAVLRQTRTLYLRRSKSPETVDSETCLRPATRGGTQYEMTACGFMRHVHELGPACIRGDGAVPCAHPVLGSPLQHRHHRVSDGLDLTGVCSSNRMTYKAW